MLYHLPFESYGQCKKVFFFCVCVCVCVCVCTKRQTDRMKKICPGSIDAEHKKEKILKPSFSPFLTIFKKNVLFSRYLQKPCGMRQIACYVVQRTRMTKTWFYFPLPEAGWFL